MRHKPISALTASGLKRRIPNVAVVAKDLYQIEFRNGVARCPYSENHNHGDRDPSFRHDRKKNRLFCSSQNCFGEKGVDVIGLVQGMERCGFTEAVQKLECHYGLHTFDTNSSRPSRSATSEQSSVRAPIPADSARQNLARHGYDAVSEYEFGSDLRKVRFEHKTKKQRGKERAEKTFRWEHLSNGIWYSGDGGVPQAAIHEQRVSRTGPSWARRWVRGRGQS